ncbi:hypothetical protein DYD83_13810 [Dickeya fangzhongdai]|uniref:Uncharacterized protein n=1 Tax=Dickeya fangzhongdai TaxID=1778540 RepID=A0A2K8QPJ3_9GAMM|nr:hypothetical protein CVE23_13745 [Dickeya fangzhongdai]QOH48390.1 hypothetical protein DYD82_13815 [Dickeya fangzhongdai]QOH52692.1 hypothetical protein DYD83_13810 [Dickeya fangzhongdai]
MCGPLADLIVFLYPLHFKLQVCWLYYSALPGPCLCGATARCVQLCLLLSCRSPVTDLNKRLGVRAVAAFLQLELLGYISAVIPLILVGPSQIRAEK